MSWGIDFKADVYLLRESFASKLELEDTIEECYDDMEDVKKRIAMYMSASLKEVVPEEWEGDKILFLRNELSDLFESYDSYFKRAIKLEMFLEYLENNPDKDIKEISNKGLL